MSDLFTPAFGRLVWKEWRIAKSFTLALLAIALSILVLAAFMSESSQTPGFGQWAGFLVSGFPLILLVGVLATGFAAEHENNTFTMQRSLPATALPVVLAKVLVAVVLSLAFFLVYGFAAGVINTAVATNIPWTYLLIAVAELSAWGTLVSMLTRRPLVSLLVSSVITVSIAFGLEWYTNRPRYMLEPDPWSALPYRWIVVSGVALAAAFLAPRWFAGSSVQWIDAVRWPWRSDPTSLATTRSSESYGRWTVAKRIIWLQYRSLRWLFVPLAIALMIGIVVSYMSSTPVAVAAWAPIAIIFVPVLGGLAFVTPENERRMLSSLHVRPLTHWLACLVLPVLGSLLIAVVVRLSVSRSSDAEVILLAATLMFAVGQVVSHLSRTALTAIGLSLALSVPTAMLFGLSLGIRLPAWVFLGPAIVLAFAATGLRHRGWLLGWKDRRFSRLTIAVIAVPIVLLAISVTSFRAFEYPAVSTEQIAGLIGTPRAPSQATSPKLLALVTETSEQYNAWTKRDEIITTDEVTGRPDRVKIAKPTNKQIKLVQRWTEATASEDFSQTATVADARLIAGNSCGAFLLRAAEYYLDESKPDAAHDAVVAAIRLRSLEYSADAALWGTTDFGYESDVDQFPLRWAASEGVTIEQLESLIEVYSKNMISLDALETATSARGVYLYQFASLDPDEAFGLIGPELRKVVRLQNWMPWERTRTRRVVGNAIAQLAGQSDHVTRAVRQGAAPEIGYLYPLRIDDTCMLSPWLESQSVAGTFLNRLRDQRATLVRLGLIHYMKTHDGELPPTVDPLASILPAESLIDPQQGQPFILLSGYLTAAMTRDGSYRRWEPVDAEQAFLWSPWFLVRRDPSSPDEAPMFRLGKTEGPIYSFDDLNRLRSYSDVRGNPDSRLALIKLFEVNAMPRSRDNTVFPVPKLEPVTATESTEPPPEP